MLAFMNTKIILGGIGGIIILSGGVYVLLSNTSVSPGRAVSSECDILCRGAEDSCPSLIDEDTCRLRCDLLSEESRAHIRAARDCEELAAKPELVAEILIPNAPEAPSPKKDATICEAACGSYVGKCLTLVPNATPALFAEGQSSCEAECARWDAKKTDCMVSAFDCESMTTVCGL